MQKFLTHPAVRAWLWFSLGTMSAHGPGFVDPNTGLPIEVVMVAAVVTLMCSHVLSSDHN